ncbi:MAG: carboxymuconolactone decarboxylase [Gammaproteobacteria bacterium]|nr:carboxymuconolactone decarboxylase [Gammaproteobacteria bacterium]
MSSEQEKHNTLRIPMVDENGMSEAQQKVYDRIVSGKRGKIVAPMRALLHSPELADRTQLLGEFVRYDTDLPDTVSELVILCVGRYWNCQQEWSIHAGIARETGLNAYIVEAIRKAEVPAFEDPMQIAVYEFTREILEYGNVSDRVYRNAMTVMDAKALIELTGIIGYYTLLAMTLNAHRVPQDETDQNSSLNLPDQDELLAPTRLPAAMK